MIEFKDIFEKLNFIQLNLSAPKGQRNKFGNYNYRSCEDITEAVKAVIGKHMVGCSLTLEDDIVLVADRVYVKATATLFDGSKSITTTAFAREPLDRKGMDASQITGTASSYARKYALNGLFAIDDTKDADTDEFQAAPKKKVIKEAKENSEPQDWHVWAGDIETKISKCKTEKALTDLWKQNSSRMGFLKVEDLATHDAVVECLKLRKEVING